MNTSKMPTLPNKTQTKSTNPSKPPSRTNSIIKPSSKKKVEGAAINKSLPSNPLSRTNNSWKGKTTKLKQANSIRVNSCQLFVRVSKIWKSSWGNQRIISDNLESKLWCPQFSQKTESWDNFQYIKLSKYSLFGRIKDTKNCFWDLLTFSSAIGKLISNFWN